MLAQVEKPLGGEEQANEFAPQSQALGRRGAAESRTLEAGTGDATMGLNGTAQRRGTTTATACGGGRSGGGGELLAGSHGGGPVSNRPPRPRCTSHRHRCTLN